jgi:hypothetical protein
MAIPISKELVSYGYYIVFEGYPQVGTELDDCGGLGKDGFKTYKEMIEEGRQHLHDAADTILLFAINKQGILICSSEPNSEEFLGTKTGEDFLEGV